MIVVSDTTPLNYLVLIEADQVLAALFDEVVVPQAVMDELNAPGAPEPVRRWAMNPPSWLIVQNPKRLDDSIRLDQGETAAISLAEEIHATLLLMDDERGRRVAMSRGHTVEGTLAVLERAGKEQLIDLDEVLDRLAKTNFRAPPALMERLRVVALSLRKPGGA